MWALSSASRTATSIAEVSATTSTQRKKPRLLVKRTKTIPYAGFRGDELRTHRIRFDLATQIRDMHPQIGLSIATRIAPHFPENLLVRERTPGMFHECPQQVPFDRSEMYFRAGSAERAVCQVQLEALQ